jgi:hypothetical protein
MYGAAATTWMQHRSALLTPEQAHLFSNDFLVTVGLSQHIAAVDPGLVADRGVRVGGG